MTQTPPSPVAHLSIAGEVRLCPCGGAAPSGRCCDAETMADGRHLPPPQHTYPSTASEVRLSPCGGVAPPGRCCDPETTADGRCADPRLVFLGLGLDPRGQTLLLYTFLQARISKFALCGKLLWLESAATSSQFSKASIIPRPESASIFSSNGGIFLVAH